MKKLFMMLVTALLFVACQNDEKEMTAASEDMGTVTFQVANYEMSSLDDEATRASISTLSYLAMGIYNAETKELISSEQKHKDDAGYGTFSVTLPYGDYTIVFLGYTGSRQANMESPTNIYFSDNYVPDLMYKTVNLTIASSETATQAIALKRAVAAFSLVSEGRIPTNVAKLTITARGGGHTFNALTGLSNSTAERSYTYNLASVAGSSSMTVTFYTFLTANESTMEFTASARDASDAEIRTRDFTSAPMKINQRTRYTGDFFASDESVQGFSISLEDGDMDAVDYTY